MLKQHWRFVNKIERIGDNAVILIAFFVAYYFRAEIMVAGNSVFHGLSEPLSVLGPLKDYVIVLFLGLALYNVVLSNLGAYRSMRLLSFVGLVRTSIAASAVVFLCESGLLFMLKLDLSRSFIGMFCFMSGVLLLVERYITLMLLRYLRRIGKNYRNVLIVGTGEQARKLYLEIVGQPELGIRVRGFVSLCATAKDRQIISNASMNVSGNGGMVRNCSYVYDLPARIIASPSSFESALKQHTIDEVLFADISTDFCAVRDMAQIAVEEGVSVSLAADLFSLEIFKSDISYFGSLHLIHYQPSPAHGTALLIKRLIDICASAVGLVCLSPLLVVTSIAIRMESKGPVFFRQKRVGLNGRIFTLIKFRSMVDNAEELLAGLKAYNEMTGPVFKMKDDPRITRVGKFIRRYSIDELPQLINVLFGDMSLVGPRPPLPDEVTAYLRKQRRRLSMRPGLTCTWQVSGRNEILDFEKWAALDLEYIDNWSLVNDIVLLVKTIPVVLRGTGAH